MKYAHQPTQIIHENYPIIIRLSILISLLIVTSLFLFIPKVISQYLLIAQVTEIDLEQVDIPMTEQLELPPPPARPSVPIESESAEISEDLTIDETTFESFDPLTIQPPPPPSNGPNVKFVPYDSPPVPIGGYASIQKRIEYPELAQEAGIDGRVIVQVFVDKKGRVKNMEILVGIPNSGLNEAAMNAIQKTRFKPAYQRDKPVAVWVSIPVHFKLDS